MRLRFSTTLAVALALHAGAMMAIRAVRAPAGASHAPPPASLEIEVEAAPVAPVAPLGPSAEEPSAPLAAARATSASLAHVTSPGGDVADGARGANGSGAPEGAIVTAPEAAPGSDPSWSAWAIATGPMDIGVGGRAVREQVARAAPASSGRTGRIDGVREALAARDQELGLGPGTPVANAARDATVRGLAPVNGFAVFEATFDGSGKVKDVRVVDVSSDQRSWEEVASSIRATLDAQSLRVPRDAQGLAVSVRVDSRWQMPDGSDPGSPKICVAGLPCDVGPHQKSIVISPLGIGGAILPSGGDKPLRVVHARVLGTRAL